MPAKSRLVALFIFSFLITAVGYSQSANPGARFERPTLLPPLNVTLHDLITKTPASTDFAHRLQIKPLVTWGDTEPIFIFPLVGSTAGAGGTFFHTETTIANNALHPQDIAVYWFPTGGGFSNCTSQPVRYHMATNTWYYWEDLAAQLLSTSGLGAVVVAAIDSAGNLDSTARLDGFSRIWTLIPGSSGSVSQSFVAESLNANASTQFAFGLRQDSSFRTNIGIFNYDTFARSFSIQLVGTIASTTTTATIDACTVSLFGAPSGTFGRLLLYITATDGQGFWYAFGSSVDNVSGASWSSVAHPY